MMPKIPERDVRVLLDVARLAFRPDFLVELPLSVFVLDFFCAVPRLCVLDALTYALAFVCLLL